MSSFAALSRFKRSIASVASLSVGVVPYLGREPLYEDANGHIFVDTANRRWIKEVNGRVYLNPDHSSGRVVEQSDGSILVNTAAV